MQGQIIVSIYRDMPKAHRFAAMRIGEI